MAKEQDTLLFACIMDKREKLKTLTVEKSINPWCFNNVKALRANAHPTLPPVTFVNVLQSPKKIRSNLDALNYDDYGVFYSLTNQFHIINRKRRTYKTMNDYLNYA
ncbi:hypothetical protein RF11_15877 [Thelohanellus kitauei]|uniref:Uncharacterized protein n=1 Tax=Thelohanellus kitauei TaxID=669202 RepID=A0A0C2MSN0_THEKT|nr:hypothetical protein RF11_15877 [Thelohanellus kitauei]